MAGRGCYAVNIRLEAEKENKRDELWAEAAGKLELKKKALMFFI